MNILRQGLFLTRRSLFQKLSENYPGLLNKAWSGQPFDFGRADEKYHITPRLTFSLMSQPDVFTNYINKNDVLAWEADFFPGFCSVRPEVLPGYGIIREASSEQNQPWRSFIKD